MPYNHQNRRNFLKLSLAASALAGPLGTLAAANAKELAVAGYKYNHVQALVDGRTQIGDFSSQFQTGKISDLNTHIFSGPQTLDVTEIGLLPFILAYANDDFRDYSLVPAFPFRMFRHKSIFIHTGRGIEKPQDLKGRRIGTPGYSSSSLTWIRGIMKDEYGVNPEDVEWVISAADSSAKFGGKASKQEQVFPDGISISIGPEGKDESDLLLDGEVDALFHAVEPRAFREGNPNVVRLFADPQATEKEYFRKTGIFPIMHAVAVKNELIETYPTLPKAVFSAYSDAKSLGYQAMESGWLFSTLPWYGQELEETKETMGENFWPYGIPPNRKTIETLCRYAYDQGLARKQVTIEDLFHPSTLELLES